MDEGAVHAPRSSLGCVAGLGRWLSQDPPCPTRTWPSEPAQKEPRPRIGARPQAAGQRRPDPPSWRGVAKHGAMISSFPRPIPRPLRHFSSQKEKGKLTRKRRPRWDESYLQYVSVSRRRPRSSSTPYGRAPAGDSGGGARSHQSPSCRSARHREDGVSDPEHPAPWPPAPPLPPTQASRSRELWATAGSPKSCQRQHSSNAESSQSTCP